MKRFLSAAIMSVMIAATCAGQPSQRRIRVGSPRAGGLINDVDQSSVAVHPATPFIEASTFGVLDIDLNEIDVQKAADWLFSLAVGASDQGMKESIATANGFIESLKTAGVDHLYVTGSTRSIMDGGPLVIVPCENPTVVNGLASVIVQAASKNRPQSVHVGERLVLAGAKPVVDRVVAGEGTPRADLILPLKDKRGLDHALVLSLPAESQAELIALWPDRLPPESPIQFSPRGLAQDIRHVVVSFRLPPEPQVRARIKTRDAAAATRVQEVVKQIFALSPQAKDAVEVRVEIADVFVESTPDVFVQIAQAVLAPARRNARQSVTVNSLKQMGLAIHNYYDVNKHLPPRCLTDREGEPLLSWRVVLLPYIEQQALYNTIHLDEPWDSDHNKPIAAVVIPVLQSGDPSSKTRFRVPVLPGSLWHGEGPPKEFKDVVDGTSRTIAVIHAPESAAVEWSNPDPWVLSADDPVSDVFGDRDRVAVVFLDGAARTFSRDELSNDKLKAMLTYAGGETID
jgi:hypothetical protein